MVRLAVVLAFIAVPLVEIYALIQVGQVIGVWWTILVLVADSLIGAWLLRRELRGTWAALRSAMGAGKLPDRELADAALVIIGGTLLLTPGFVTDIVGFFFLLPITRPIARRGLLAFVGNRLRVQTGRWMVGGLSGQFGAPRGDGSSASGFGGRPAPAPGAGRGRVIQGEIVDDDPPA